MSAIVEMQKVARRYALGKTTVTALQEIDLVIERGEFAVIAGPSGSGKTTCLNLIGCVDVPSDGTVKIDGVATSSLTDKQLTDLRLNKIGFIFQSFNLINVLDIYQNVEFPLLLQGTLSPADRKKRVEEMVEKVGLTKQIRQRPNELSGGQRQRVAIARALVTRPALVLADEPTANLDSVTGTQIIDLMHDLNKREKTTFLFSTHDPKVMNRAERIIRVLDGRIVTAAAEIATLPEAHA
jgi:putative ABC transport system ATP-binding protein